MVDSPVSHITLTWETAREKFLKTQTLNSALSSGTGVGRNAKVTDLFDAPCSVAQRNRVRVLAQ